MTSTTPTPTPAPSLGVPQAQLIIDLTQTDLPAGTPVYVYVVGEIQAPGANYYYYLDRNFMPQKMAGTDNTQKSSTFPDMEKLPLAAKTALAQNYQLNWADWSIPVQVGSNLILCLGNINTTNMPELGTGTAAFSARIYVSVGLPRLPFAVTTDSKGTVTGYTAPVFGNESGVFGSMTLFDWIEFSYDSDGNFNGNTTQVNQFGFPLYLRGYTTDKEETPLQGVLTASRADILKRVAAFPAPFSASASLVKIPPGTKKAYPPGTKHLRAISPSEVSSSGHSLSGYFSGTVTAAYQGWQSSLVRVTDVSTGTYTGIAMPMAEYPEYGPPPGYQYGAIAFYQGAYKTQMEAVNALGQPMPAPAFWVGPIRSDDIWQCGGSLVAGGPAQKNVEKILAAAFNRGRVVKADRTVRSDFTDKDCASDASSFYAEGTTFNPWAKLFHEVNLNGLAYAFSYDDVCQQSTTLPVPGQTLVASAIRVVLGPFYAAGAQPAPPSRYGGEERDAPSGRSRGGERAA